MSKNIANSINPQRLAAISLGLLAVAALASEMSFALPIIAPSATYSLDAQQQLNGVLVNDIPASGTYANPTSVTLTSPVDSTTMTAGVGAGFFGPLAYASGTGFGGDLLQNNNYFQASSAYTYSFEISTSGYTGQLPHYLLIDLTFALNANVVVTGSNNIGGSSQAIAMLNIPYLSFYSQAVQACGNTGQGGISCFLNLGTPAGVLIQYNGQTYYPTLTSYTGTQVLKIKYNEYNTWISVDMSAFCNSQASYPSLGGSRTCFASVDPLLSFDPSNGTIPSQIQILQSANNPAPSVPEPTSWLMLASGVAGLGAKWRMKR